MQDLSLDGIIAILNNTILSIKGSFGLAFAVFVCSVYNIHSTRVHLALAWAFLVSLGNGLAYLNRAYVSRGSTKLFPDDVVVITGASSGLGLYLSAALSQTNRVIGIDIEKPPLEMSNVNFMYVDCADEQQVKSVAKLNANCLINCAGVARGGSITELSSDDIKTTMDTNFLAPVWMTRALLPHMLRTHGYIVNISSSTSFVGPRKAGLYAASKAAIRIWHESLRQELKGSDVKSILVTPGQLNTPMFKNVQTPDKFLAPVVLATDLGDQIVTWLRRGYAGEIVTPFYARILPIVLTVLPQSLIDFLRAWNGLDSSMDTFNAPSDGGEEPKGSITMRITPSPVVESRPFTDP